jgi:hypothetical protein
MYKKIFGLICVVFAAVFGWQETIYFGNNLLPNSKEELMCDLASLLLAVAGHILYWSNYKTFKNKENA